MFDIWHPSIGAKHSPTNAVEFPFSCHDDTDLVYLTQAGIAFAQQHNIRLLVRNTGHEYVYYCISAFS